MKLRIVWVGKTKSPHLAKLCEDYVGRIRHFLPVEIADVKSAKLSAAVDAAERVVALDPGGKQWTSEQFSQFLERHINSDPRRLTFVIGDYNGLPPEVVKRADIRWSLSSLTFTHDMARVLVLEQIYRALSIIHNFPYSK
jgi:23S rRNA (pseudouridine1915-N3)-methyltransferase